MLIWYDHFRLMVPLLLGPGRVAPEAPVVYATLQAPRQALRVVEIGMQEDTIFEFIVRGPKGTIRILTDVSEEGSTLILRNAHIEGVAQAGTAAGKTGIVEMREAVKKIGREWNAREVQSVQWPTCDRVARMRKTLRPNSRSLRSSRRVLTRARAASYRSSLNGFSTS